MSDSPKLPDRPARVCVVILNWRRNDLLGRCLSRIAEQRTRSQLHLVVFENESCELDRAEIVEQLTAFLERKDNPIDSVSLLASDANLGFAAGMNRAVEFAQEQFEPAYYWLLNNDAEPEPVALDALLEKAEAQPRWGIIGSRILGEPLAGGKPLFGGYRYFPWSTRLRPCLQAAEQPDYVAGAAMFVRAQVFRKVGLLSEEFFLFGEELDFAHRAADRGWDCGCAPDSLVWHHSGQSVAARSPWPGRTADWTREYFENRSAFLLAWRNHRGRFPVSAMVRVGAKAVLALMGQSRFGAVWAALRSFRRPLPAPLQSAQENARVWLVLHESSGNG